MFNIARIQDNTEQDNKHKQKRILPKYLQNFITKDIFICLQNTFVKDMTTENVMYLIV